MSQLLHRAAWRCFFALFLIQSAGVHVTGFSVFERRYEGTCRQLQNVHKSAYLLFDESICLFHFDQTATVVIISMNKPLHPLQLVHEKAPQPHFFAFLPLPHEHGSFGCETIERGLELRPVVGGVARRLGESTRRATVN